MLRTVAGVVLLLATVASASVLVQENEARRQLMPTGRLRVGINAGNILTREVGSDLGRDIARRLGAQVMLIEYASPGAVVDAVKEWDIAFIAADPARETEVSFTAPYVELDATYLVPANSPIRGVADADRAGFTIASNAGTAYTLVLQRDLTKAKLVSMGNEEGVKGMQAGNIQAVAGLRDGLVRIATRTPELRVLQGNIARAQQAIGVPKANRTALEFVTAYLRDAKASGLVASSIESAVRKTGFVGASAVK